MEFLQQNPFIRLLLPLIVGILFGYFVTLPTHYYIALAGFILLLFSCLLLFQKYKLSYQFRWIIGLSIQTLVFALGVWLTAQQLSKVKQELPTKEIVYQAEIINSPEEKSRSVLCKVKINWDKKEEHRKTDEKEAILYLEKNEHSLSLKNGDIILAKTKLSKPTNNHNPGGFDYANYLQLQGIIGTAYVPSEKWIKLRENHDFSIISLAEKCQQHLLNVYKKYQIESDEFGVLAALTLGHKDSLDPDLQDSYSGSGAMHILAVSGLHVGVIYIVLSFILSFIFRGKRMNILNNVIILVFLWVYAFITGLTPSVLRATVMFSFVIVGNCIRSKSPTYNRIAASALILLLINPFLLFNIGFQLSYSAVIAIIYFHPKISKLFYFRSKPTRWLWDLTAVSIAAQIGTAPWALLYFNQFTNYFLLTNIVAIPMASIIIYTALLLLLLSPINVLAKPIAALLNGEVKLLNKTVESIDKLPYSVSEIAIDHYQMILLFTAVILFMIFHEKRKYSFWMAGLCTILTFCGTHIYKQINTLNTEKIIVYSDNKEIIIQQTYGRENLILTTDTKQAEYLTKKFSLQNKLNDAKLHILKKDSASFSDKCFMFGGEKYMIIQNNFSKHRNIKHNIETDYLLLGEIGYTDISSIVKSICTQKIILLNSFPYWKKEEIEIYATQHNISLHDISTEGAWKLTNRIKH